MTYSEVQNIAKETMAYIKTKIYTGMNLKELRALCEKKMMELGADSFWYWDVGAFVFSGDETTLSVSGRTYQTADKTIEANDIITIDLSPQADQIWGDFARTIILENGIVIDDLNNIQVDEWKNGLIMEEKLHKELFHFATPEMTFEELYYHMNEYISNHGYINLDFLGNLGHSIVRNKKDRIYIEKGNHAKLGDVEFFTLEPHISTQNSKWGYKMENIYYFTQNKLLEL